MKTPFVPKLFLELLLVSLAFSLVAASKDDGQYMPRSWQTEDGLPENTVQAATQTSDGYLWIGMPKAAARFDGMQFTILQPTNFPSAKKNSITALCATRDGALWLGSADAGLIRLKDGQTTIFAAADGLGGNSIKTIFESRDGTLWIGTTNGVAYGANGRFKNFTVNDGLANHVVRAICEDERGTVWILTAGGLNSWKDGQLSLFDRTLRGRAICLDAKGNIWIGSAAGLFRLKDGKMNRFTTEDGLPDNQITALCEDRSGNLWVGSYGGLCRIANGKIHAQLNSENQPFDLVNAIFQDVEGNVWIGARGGLARLSPKSFFTYTKDDGLSHNNVISVCETKDGEVWAGTWGGGLDCFKDGKFSRWTNSSLSELILGLCDAAHGALYVGTDFEHGMFLINYPPYGGTIHYGDAAGIVDPAVKVIYIDHKKRLWAGTSLSLNARLDRSKSDKFTRFTPENGLAGVPVNVMQEDQKGKVWIGTGGGLSRWDEGAFTNFTMRDGLSHNVVNAICKDADGTFWIGTGGGGVCRMKNEKLKMQNEPNEHPQIQNSQSAISFTAYTSKDGLFSDEIFEILEDSEGWLWMTCRDGIFSLPKSDLVAFDEKKIPRLACRVYGKNDGLLSLTCSGVAKPAAWKGRDGRLWFATSKGLAVVNPKTAARRNDSAPPVVVERIVADKKAISSSGKMAIPPGRGEVEFHYTALSFSAPDKNRFKYKLEGYDNAWNDAATRRVAYYNNLSPGDYRFCVMACNSDGVWNETGANVAFTLLPHFWQTTWFIGLLGFTVIGAVAGTARYFTRRKVQRELSRLEQQHAIERERNRIAQDMHDDLGARLTEIVLLSDRVQKGKSPEEAIQTGAMISDAAREVAASINAIVWAVNPKNDSIDKTISYLCNYAVRFLAKSSIECRLDVPEDLPALPVSSEVRHNLFLVCKEALNNIVKHSDATVVCLSVRLHESELSLSIEDNGKGFAPSEKPETGNGLSNMKKRIRLIGGEFKLESDSGKGTKIQAHIRFREQGRSAI